MRTIPSRNNGTCVPSEEPNGIHEADDRVGMAVGRPP